MRFLIATYAWFLATLPEAFARANAWGFSWALWGLRRKIIAAPNNINNEPWMCIASLVRPTASSKRILWPIQYPAHCCT